MMVFVRLESHAVENDLGVTEKVLLDDPPHRRSERDMAAHTSWHTRVKHGNHTTVASPDEQARVVVLGEIVRLLIEVIDDDFL